MSSPPSLSLWAPILALVITCGGGSNTQEEKPRQPKTETPKLQIPISGYAGEQPTSGVQESLNRSDPANTKFYTEHLHELAKPELAEFVAEMGSILKGKKYDLYLAQSFEGTTSWAPERLEVEFEDETLRHRLGVEFSRERHGAEQVKEVVASLLAPLGWTASEREAAGVELHTKTKIFTTDQIPGSPRLFTTEAMVIIDGPRPAGQSVQINMEWLVKWEVVDPRKEGEHAAILAIELLSYRDTLNKGPLIFANVTEHVFGSVPRFGSEFLIGAAEYHHKLDLMDGNVFSGQIGVAVGDIDGDGLEDLFIPQQGGHPNRLLRHLPDDTLEDISAGSGLELLEGTQSALILDFDNDGHADIAMACDNLLEIGYGDGTGKFKLMRPFSARRTSKIKSMVAADWDNDGDLDIYTCMYSKQGPLGTTPNPYHDATNGPPNVAWRNDLDATLDKHRWIDVTEELGFNHHNNKFSYAAIFEDFDSDSDLDLYVVNDFGRNNFYRNDDGHFSDVAIEVGADDVAAGMGVSAGDVDGDGDVDLYVTNMWSSAGRRIASQAKTFMQDKDSDVRAQYLRHARGNTLLLNRGDGTFDDATEASGAMNGGWAWGALLVDLNNDGLLDAYSPNGFITGIDRHDL